MADGLADRVNARAQQQAAGGGEVARREPPSLRKQIEEMVPQFELAMPKGFEAKQLMRDAFTLLRQNPQLGECVPESVLGGLMTFAQLGLRPGVMGQGWLIPFKNWKKNNRLEAQIVIGYQGYVELVHRSGAARKLVGRAVHENDFFEIEYGTEEKLVHRPPVGGGDRGRAIGYYAIIFYHDADPLFWYMSHEEGIEWRNHYAMAVKRGRGGVPQTDNDGNVLGSGPWFEMDGPEGGTGFSAMVTKTCFLRAKRWAPKSTDRMLTAASEVDGAVRLSFKPSAAEDYDEMLTAQHPAEGGDVIDGELVDDAPPAQEQPAARERVNVQHRPADDVPPPPDPDAAAAGGDAGDDRPASDNQGRALAAILRKGLGKTPAQGERRTLLTGLIGRPVESQKDVTFAEASKAIDTLNAWQKAGELEQRVQAMLGSPAGEQAGDEAGAPAGDTRAEAGEPPAGALILPTPGTRAWHLDGHPVDSGGHVTRVPVQMNGDCGICEEPEGDPRDEEDFPA